MGFTVASLTGVAQEVDATHKAARVSARPLDHGLLGHYSYAGFTGIIAAALAANAELFQFRWQPADVTRLAVINEIKISAAVSTTMFAAGVPLQLELKRCNSWSVAGSGGTGITMGTEGKDRASMAPSSLVAGDMRIATTAGLTIGTKNVEGIAIAAMAGAGPITGSLNGQIIAPQIMWRAEVGDGQHPLVLAATEGFVIRAAATPGTGTWTLQVQLDWAEVAAY
jgi:hypothetical protein